MARGIRRLGSRGGRGARRGRRELARADRSAARLTCGAGRVTHSSWVEHRADSYGRLAFLGDSVLGLAVAEHLFRRYPRADIGRLTKMHGQAVSGRACAEVAVELGVPALLREAAPAKLEGGIDVEALLASRARAGLGLRGGDRRLLPAPRLRGPPREATVAAFANEIEIASERLLDFKSALQERLAREGSRVRYEVTARGRPAARPPLRGRGERRRATVIGTGSGAEQEGRRAGGRRRGAGRLASGRNAASGDEPTARKPSDSTASLPGQSTCI